MSVGAAFEDVSVSFGPAAILRDFALDVAPREVLGLVGPNGSGKSTALRCLYRSLAPDRGVVRVGPDDLTDLSLRESARLIGAVAQDGRSELDFTVAELVALGRTPHLRGNEPLGPGDRARCREAMARLDVLHLAGRGILELSGGERQRALIARALVQEPAVLVLDEPTNHLDVRHQIELLSLLGGTGTTVVVVLHDLNLAAAACDRLAVVDDGGVVAVGPPADVLTPELVRTVFGVDAQVVPHPLTGAPQLLFDLHRRPARSPDQ